MSTLTKKKALHRAKSLDFMEQAEALHFLREGSVDAASFTRIVEAQGIGLRKARYLLNIYVHLTERGIDLEEVREIGWTKLKEIYPMLDKTNVAEWIRRVRDLSTLELQELLENGTITSPTKIKPRTEPGRSFLTFRVSPDQRKAVEGALAKAGAVVHGRHRIGRTEAMVKICNAYS